MSALNKELSRALDEALSGVSATAEFKRRLRALVDNVISGQYTDNDIEDVVNLAPSETAKGS